MQALKTVRQRRLLVGAVFYVNVLSLGCQLLWVRRFNVLFGSTAAVFGSVLCAFLLGLAVGAEVGGRRAAGEQQPWRTLGGSSSTALKYPRLRTLQTLARSRWISVCRASTMARSRELHCKEREPE